MLTLFAYLRAFLRTRHHLGLEILALRQQVAVLKRKHPRPRLNNLDRLFWLALRRLWSRWADALILVKPETVVGWHRAGFRLYWRLRSQGGGRKIGGDMLEIVRRMSRENPSWGAPRFHGELRIPTKKITHSELSAIKSGAAATAIGSESAGTCSII